MNTNAPRIDLPALAHAWVDWASAASWQIALLVILIAVAAFASRRHSARFRYLLWMLVVIKALTPPTLGAVWSLGNWLGPQSFGAAGRAAGMLAMDHGGGLQELTPTPLLTPAGAAASPAVPLPVFGAAPPVADLSIPSPAASAPERLPFITLLMAGWLAGVAAICLFIAFRYLRLRRALRWAAEVDEGPLRILLERQTIGLGGQNPPRLLLSNAVTSPFLFGFLHPRIVLPANLPEDLSPAELGDVLLHELIHWRRHDLWAAWLQILVQTLFWFHPLVWFAGAQLRHERECACDEAALASGRTPARRYGESLLRVLLAARGRPAVGLGMLGIFERNSRLQKRLEEIMNQESRVRRFGPRGWTALALFAVICLPMAAQERIPADEDLGYSPLHFAARNGHRETVTALLEAGADVNARGLDDKTPLHLAAEGGHSETAQVLLDAGADFNARDLSGRTPLSAAAEQGHADLARLLIARGAILTSGEMPLREISRGKPVPSDSATSAHDDNSAIRETVRAFLAAVIAGDREQGAKYADPQDRNTILSRSFEMPLTDQARDHLANLVLDQIVIEGDDAFAITPPGPLPDPDVPGELMDGNRVIHFRLRRVAGQWRISGFGNEPAGQVENRIEAFRDWVERQSPGASISANDQSTTLPTQIPLSDPIVGRWRGEDAGNGTVMIFEADGSWQSNDKGGAHDQGQWSFSDDDYRIIDSANQALPFDVQVTTDLLTLTNVAEPGEKVTLRRETGTLQPAPLPGEGDRWMDILTENQRFFIAWTESRFDRMLDRRDFSAWPAAERDALLEDSLRRLQGPQNREYYEAINTLGALGDRRAVQPLLAVATDRIGEDCRDNWMAARALGMIGEPSVVPQLIHLSYHTNTNTHFWAQISLVRLTGHNFDYDWQAWGGWWNENGGQPSFVPAKIRWWDDPRFDEASTAEALMQADQEFIDEQRALPGKEQSTAPAQPPIIVSSSPATGAIDVDPGLQEITVTFDRDMAGGFSWTGGGPDFPPGPPNARAFWRDKRTCVKPVQLEPGRYYRIGINSTSHQNFRGADGVPVRPAAISFTTAGASPEAAAKAIPPVILRMEPENGATDVDPALQEIRVTFNIPMGGGFSWCGGGEHYPEIPGGLRPHWSEDRRTCILPVRLKPNWEYRLGINCPSANNFQSDAGVPLEPVGYVFRTGGA